MSEIEEPASIIEGAGDIVISVRHGVDGTPMRFVYKAGDSVFESIEIEGADVVFANYLVGIKTAARNKLNTIANKTSKEGKYVGMMPEEAIIFMQSWRPTNVNLRTKKSDIDKLLEGRSQEELEKIIAECQEKMTNEAP